MIHRSRFMSEFSPDIPRRKGSKVAVSSAFRAVQRSVDAGFSHDSYRFVLNLEGRNGSNLKLELTPEQIAEYVNATGQGVYDQAGNAIGMSCIVTEMSHVRVEIKVVVEPEDTELEVAQQWAIPKWSDTVVLPVEWVRADDYPLTDPADITVPFEIINTSSPELAIKVRDALNEVL